MADKERRRDPGHEVEAAGHPRPLLRREQWWSLAGEWQFAADADRVWERPEQPDFDGRIVVPFAPETPASGIGDIGYLPRCWYRRDVAAPSSRRKGDRLRLHFGAVDHAATVWLDGQLV